MPISWSQAKALGKPIATQYPYLTDMMQVKVTITHLVYAKGTRPLGLHVFGHILHNGDPFRAFIPTYKGDPHKPWPPYEKAMQIPLPYTATIDVIAHSKSGVPVIQF
jgi:hypothetical protein